MLGVNHIRHMLSCQVRHFIFVFRLEIVLKIDSNGTFRDVTPSTNFLFFVFEFPEIRFFFFFKLLYL